MMSEHNDELSKELDDIFPNIFSQKTIDELRDDGVVIEDSPYIVCDCCDQEDGDESDSEFDEETKGATDGRFSRFQMHPYLAALMKFYLEECEYAPFVYLILFSLFGILVPISFSVLISITLCFSTVVIKFHHFMKMKSSTCLLNQSVLNYIHDIFI